MRMKSVLALSILVLLVSLSVDALAYMHRVNFQAFTMNKPDGQFLGFWVKPVDDVYNYGPSFVKTITLIAPTSPATSVSMNPIHDWNPWEQRYGTKFLAASAFGGTIPSGTYKVKVESTAGNSITESDSVGASFLPLPVLTYPTNNTTGVGASPTIKWNAVSGATSYRIVLINLYGGPMPVYDRHYNQKFTDYLSYKVPLGTLKPNTEYYLSIDAFAGDEADKLSSCQSVWFKTGSW